jgi:hypothetical protein
VTDAPLKLVTPAQPVTSPLATQSPERLVEVAAAPASDARTAPPAVPGFSGETAFGRVQTFSAHTLAVASYRLRRVGTSGLAGLALLLAAVVLYVANNLPQSAIVQTLTEQVRHLAPLNTPVAIPGNGTVLAALPPRADAPAVVGRVFEQAAAAGVELSRGEYEFLPAREGVAAHYRMTFPVRTTYPQLRDFMDRTLAALPGVAVEGLRVERKNVGDETVDAELKLDAYVRSDP